MPEYRSDEYRIEIFDDHAYSNGSVDNVNQYDFIYFLKSDFYLPSVFGVKIFYDDVLLNNAVIGSTGGATAIHENSIIIEKDRLLICCSETIFCLSIPNLALLWQTKADASTCFEIFEYQDSYIVHGELDITRLDKNGKIIWQQSGADIFTTLSGKDDFLITDNYILATEWGNRKYKFDFDGQIIE